MIFESANADALYLNWAVPQAALPPAPTGLRYDLAGAGPAGSESLAYFSLVLFRQVGLHLRGASWLALSYPQANARLYVRDASNTAAVLVLRQLVPGWVVPIGRLVGGQPLSAAVLSFPDDLATEGPGRLPGPESGEAREWRWKFSAGDRFEAAVRLDVPGGATAGPAAASWQAEVAFFRERSRTFWRYGRGLRRAETEPAATAVQPVRARLEQTGWLETFLPFAPLGGWSEVHSAFLVSRAQMVFAYDAVRDLPVAAPMAAAG